MTIQFGKFCVAFLFSFLLVHTNIVAETADDSVPYLFANEPKEQESETAKKSKAEESIAEKPKVQEAAVIEKPAVETTASEKKTKLGKFVVTGSHISRVDLEGPTPLLVLDKEYIEQTGATTTYELLNNLTFNNGTPISENENLGTSPGGSTINLRGLGKGATLVLLNGRRLPNFGFPYAGAATFVDLNSIPVAAIDRVEVLKDGASAIYGADALAGVVNIILKKNYEGTEITAGYGVSAEGKS